MKGKIKTRLIVAAVALVVSAFVLLNINNLHPAMALIALAGPLIILICLAGVAGGSVQLARGERWYRKT